MLIDKISDWIIIILVCFDVEIAAAVKMKMGQNIKCISVSFGIKT